MNYVDQAYSITKEQKALSKDLYKESVKELASKNYVMGSEDAFTELSVIFGMKWIRAKNPTAQHWMDPKQYAEANTAFNYAHLNLGIEGRFIGLAKELVAECDRLSDKALNKIGKKMNYCLTHTTAEDWNFA